jgi:hypothetical protein
MTRFRPKSVRSAKQQQQSLNALKLTSTTKENKENTPPGASVLRNHGSKEAILAKTKIQLDNTQRKVRHLKTRNGTLKEKLAITKTDAKVAGKSLEASERQRVIVVEEKTRLEAHLVAQQTTSQELSSQLMQERQEHRDKVEKLSKRLRRRDGMQKRAVEQAATKTRAEGAFKLMQKKSYTAKTRKLARMLVANGCARSKVGHILSDVGKELGVPLVGGLSHELSLRDMLARKCNLDLRSVNLKVSRKFSLWYRILTKFSTYHKC